jgi:hypothetical protein
MEGMGGFPANFLYFTFYRNTWGREGRQLPVPPIVSLLSFLLSVYFLE